jgi:hypothetical protein
MNDVQPESFSGIVTLFILLKLSPSSSQFGVYKKIYLITFFVNFFTIFVFMERITDSNISFQGESMFFLEDWGFAQKSSFIINQIKEVFKNPVDNEFTQFPYFD